MPDMWILGALVLVAAAVRFATLDVQSIWLDESATMALLHKSFTSMLSALPSSESTPPAYYVLSWAWSRIFGVEIVSVRALSALIGTAMVPVAYLAARAASRRAGLWAAAIVTVSPLGFYYSQEARAYALLMLICGIGFVLWLRAMDDPTPSRLRWWAGISCLSLVTHYFALFVVVGEVIGLVRRVGWRALTAELAAIVVVGIALLPLALRQRSDGKSDWIEDSSLPSRLAQGPKQFLVGIDGPAELLTAAVAILLAAAAVGLIVARGNKREREIALRAVLVVGVALLIPAICSVTGVIDVFNGRNVVASWIIAMALIAVGLGTTDAPRAVTTFLGVALCAVLAFVVIGVLSDSTEQRDDWRGVDKALGALPAPAAQERVIVAPTSSDVPLGYFIDGLRAVPAGRAVQTRVLELVTLRVREGVHSTVPPVVPAQAPPGFRLDGRRTTSTYSVSRYVADAPTRVSDAQLAPLLGESEVELIRQPAPAR